MTENKNQDLSMSRTKMNQDVYKELYTDEETEFRREAYRKENKITALFKEDNFDDTFELKFDDLDQSKKRDEIAIENFIDLEKPNKVKKVDPTASLDEYFSAVDEEPTQVNEPNVDEELNELLEKKYQELNSLRESLEKAKEVVEEPLEHSNTIDTEMINALLNPEPISKEELLGDQEVETEELEDFIINSLIDNINGNGNPELTKTATQEIPNEKLFELTSTLSVEGLSEIEESIRKNNRKIKILIMFLIVIVCVLGYIFISGS